MSNVCAPTVGTPVVESSVELGPRLDLSGLCRRHRATRNRGHRRSTGRDFHSNANIGVTILVAVKG
jgi:hypothetical protein